MVEHEHALLHFTRALLRDTDLALDCVQDTFLRAYESLGRGRPVNRQWLFTVARNRAIDEFRRRRWLQSEPDHLRILSFEESSDTCLAVRQAMDRLPPQYQEVLCLFVVAGFKTEEIAELLETTGPAVRQRLYRARREFRRAYMNSHFDQESAHFVAESARSRTPASRHGRVQKRRSNDPPSM